MDTTLFLHITTGLVCIIYGGLFALRFKFFHPINIFFIFFFLYFPFKYLFIRTFGLDFEFFAAEILGSNIQLAMTLLGISHFLMLLISAVTHFTLSLTRISLRNLALEPRFDCFSISVILHFMFPLIFMLSFGLDKLLSGLEFRFFMHQKGMGYVSQIMATLFSISYVMALSKKNNKKTILLTITAFSYALLSGTSAIFVNAIILYFLFHAMVNRYTPLRPLLVTALLGPALVLIHGLMRTTNSLITGAISISAQITEFRELFVFIANAFVARIGQLEASAMVIYSISNNTVSTSPQSLLNVFIQIIPRALWPEKPYFFNSEIMSRFFPDLLQSNVTFNFTALAELVYYFHLNGVLIAGVVLGVLFYISHRFYLIAQKNEEYFLTYYTFILPLLLGGFHVGWLNTPIIPNIIISLAVCLFFTKIKIRAK